MLHGRQFGLANQSFGEGLGFDLVDWNPAPVIVNADNNAVAFLARGNGQLSFARFSFGLSLHGSFDTVVDRIAHQVHQRIADFVGDGLVELSLFAAHFQTDLFIEFLRQVADHSGQLCKHFFDREHAGFHDGQL